MQSLEVGINGELNTTESLYPDGVPGYDPFSGGKIYTGWEWSESTGYVMISYSGPVGGHSDVYMRNDLYWNKTADTYSTYLAAPE